MPSSNYWGEARFDEDIAKAVCSSLCLRAMVVQLFFCSPIAFKAIEARAQTDGGRCSTSAYTQQRVPEASTTEMR